MLLAVCPCHCQSAEDQIPHTGQHSSITRHAVLWTCQFRRTNCTAPTYSPGTPGCSWLSYSSVILRGLHSALRRFARGQQCVMKRAPGYFTPTTTMHYPLIPTGFNSARCIWKTPSRVCVPAAPGGMGVLAPSSDAKRRGADSREQSVRVEGCRRYEAS